MREAPLVVDLHVELHVDMFESRVEMVESRVEFESMVLGVVPSLRRLFLVRAACP